MDIDRPQLIARLEATHPTLVQLTRDLSAAVLDFHPGPAEWSIREILAHLVDDEMYVMRTRLERMIKEDEPLLAPHDEQRWYATRNMSRDELTQLLDDFALQRAASLGIIRMLREAEWKRVGIQPEYGRFTAEEWLGRWAAHDRTHVEQIEANIAAFTRPSTKDG